MNARAYRAQARRDAVVMVAVLGLGLSLLLGLGALVGCRTP